MTTILRHFSVDWFDLPWPPSVNHYWRHVVIKGQVRVLISAEGRAYRSAVAVALRQRFQAWQPITCRLGVDIAAYPPDRRARDLDNLQKAPLDSLTHAGVWGDDSQIDTLRITRGPVRKGGQIRITLILITQGIPA